MIKNFQDADTQLLWKTGGSRRIPANLQLAALKKFSILHWAATPSDLAIPPGNRLEALRCSRKGQHSIRINDQFRLCFQWRDGHAHNVEIVDYN